MNNNFNQNNGQFGGWGQANPQYTQYNPHNSWNYQNHNEQQMKNQEKLKDKKNLRKMGKSFGLCIIAYVIISFAVSLAVELLSMVFPSLKVLYTDSTAEYAYSVIASILYIGLPFGVAYLTLKENKLAGILPYGTTYNRKASIYMTMFFVPLIIFLSIAVNIVSLIFQTLADVTFTSGLEDLSVDGIGGFIISTISMAVVPAIVEEFAIRGVVLQPLRRYGDTFAIVMSAVVFSIMHGNMAQIPYTMTGGIILGYLAVATGSIWPSIIVHFINNFYSVVVLSVSSNYGENMSVIATGIIMVLFVVMGIIGAAGFFSMRYKVHLAKGVNTLKTSEKISALFLNVPMIIAFLVMAILVINSIE